MGWVASQLVNGAGGVASAFAGMFVVGSLPVGASLGACSFSLIADLLLVASVGLNYAKTCCAGQKQKLSVSCATSEFLVGPFFHSLLWTA
ncbi:hypothetical protein GCM10023166_18450 [Paeniglutamicibacter cryotolerans]